VVGLRSEVAATDRAELPGRDRPDAVRRDAPVDDRPVTTAILNAASCVSAADCFAVGYYDSSDGLPLSLVEHWNGSAWSILSSPNPTGSDGFALHGVSCVSTTSCFAVGDYLGGLGDKTLVEHWNGSAWSILSSPNPTGADDTALYGVSCVSTTGCFAVGSSQTGTVLDSLVEHWNGSAWSIMTSPNPTGSTDTGLSSVSCANTTSCFAVGSYITASANKALVEHWNGSAWSIMSSPNPAGSRYTGLLGVSCPSTTTCFAVGDYSTTAPTTKSLVEHWNGTSWTIMTSPNPTGSATYVVGVSCPNTTSCFAVGSYITTSAGKTLVEYWNGSAWSIMTSPNPTGSTYLSLNGVSCPSTTSCFAIGSYLFASSSKTLVERDA
jgi:hypothetical protein